MDPERWRQIEKLYHSALERDPEHRHTFLAALCGGDHEILHEVEALLEADGSGECLVEKPFWEQPDLAELLLNQPSASLCPGTELGPYIIERLIAAGGMGEVYHANDRRLRRSVAVKVLTSSLARSACSHQRINREARAISSLNHPNICTIYDVGEYEQQPFIVMELLEGHTIKDLDSKALKTVEVLRLAIQITEGLAAAHQKGIIHRDIKPANVFVTACGQAKILDFGLAKLVSTGELALTRSEDGLTNSGAVIGTVAYMSPEQARGEEVDARTDLFSLDAVLYEMVTGKPPFTGKTWAAILDAILEAEPDRPSDTNSDVPLELDHVIRKSLEKDRELRYQSAVELRADLKRVQRDFNPEAPGCRLIGQNRQLSGGNPPSLGREPIPNAGIPVLDPIRRKTNLRPVWIAAAAVLVTFVLAAAWISRGAPESSANPLTNAEFTRVTNFESSETDGAISRDGKFVAFRSDRDGPAGTWVSQIGTGRFINLTHGNQDSVFVRNMGFTAEGSEIWLAGFKGGPRLRLVPLTGGPPRAFLAEHAVNATWSPDGARIVFHTDDAGDPMFVSDSTGANAKQIFRLGPGGHNHFSTWSVDGR